MFAKTAALLFIVGIVAPVSSQWQVDLRPAPSAARVPPGTFKTCGEMMSYIVQKSGTPMKCVAPVTKECCSVCTYNQNTPTCKSCLESSAQEKLGLLFANGCFKSGRRLRSKQRSFIEAAKYNEANRVGNLIRLGANVNQVDSNGKTALHWAARYGFVDVVEKLLFHYMSKGKVKYDLRDKWGWTPLNLAVHCTESEDCSDNVQIMKYLLRGNVNVNAESSKEWTPLGRAAMFGFEEGVRLLLAHPDIEVNYGVGDKNPLHLALENKHYRIAALLRQAGAVEPSRRRLAVPVFGLWQPGTFKTCGEMMSAIVQKADTPMKCVAPIMKECCSVCTYDQNTPTCKSCLWSSSQQKLGLLYANGCFRQPGAVEHNYEDIPRRI